MSQHSGREWSMQPCEIKKKNYGKDKKDQQLLNCHEILV